MFRVSNTIFPGKLREVCWPLHISNAGYWTNSEGCTVLMPDKLPCCNAIKLNANGLEAALTSKPLCEYKYTSFTAKSWQTMNFHRIRRFYTSQMWKLKSFFGDVLIKSLRLCIHINLAIPSRDLLTSLLKESYLQNLLHEAQI